MIWTRWMLLLGSLGGTPTLWAQEPSSAKPDTKATTTPKDTSDPKTAEILDKAVAVIRANLSQKPEGIDKAAAAAKVKVDDLIRDKLKAAQEQEKRARADLQKAQLEAQQTLRAFNEAQRAMSRQESGSPQRSYQTTRQYVVKHPMLSDFVRAYGLDFTEADPVLRSQLNIPPTEGLVIVTLNPGGLADKAGIKKNDLIAKINMMSVNNVAKARELIESKEKPTAYFDLYRAGKPIHLTMTKPTAPSVPTVWHIGVALASVDEALRSQLPELPADAGLVATEVTANGPASRAGLKANDILVRANDQPLTSREFLVDLVQKLAGEPLRLQTLQGGTTNVLTIHPEKRPVTEVAISNGSQQFQYKLENQSPLNYTVHFLNGNNPIPTTLFAPFSNGQQLETNNRLEQEVKALSEQVEALRRAITELSKK